MMRLLSIAGFTALLVGPAASPTPARVRPQAPERVSQATELTIVDLVGRDRVITITTGVHGVRYSARTNAGEMIASDLSLQELQASHPDLYRQLNGAAANAAPTIDASVDLTAVGD